jgi:Fe-S oxidoreductase
MAIQYTVRIHPRSERRIAMIARPLYWNIDLFSKVSMYVLALVAFVVFAYGVKQRVAYWRQAKPDGERWSSWATRLGLLFNEIALQRTVLKKGYAGLFHSFIFYSFVACAIATAAAFAETDFLVFFNHAKNAQGGYDQLLFDGFVYDLLSFGAELGGLLILVGLGMAAWRRYVQKPAHLERKQDDAIALGLIAAIIVTGFASEAIRIHHTGETHPWTSFFAYLLATPFGMPATPVLDAHAGSSIAHKLFWWLHMVLAMGFIAFIPYTKLFHLLAIPTGVLKARLSTTDPLPRVDLEALMADEHFDEATFTLGKGDEKAFTFEDRVDHDACIECGRCQEACPAARAGDPFGPKTFIQKLRDHGHAMLEKRQAPKPPPAEGGEPAAEEPVLLIESVFEPNFPWFCRTCRACMEVCPARIEHVPAFIELRRNEVSIQGRLPDEAQAPLRQLQSSMNSIGAQEDRVDWIAKTGVRVVGPEEECEVLYFIGCLTSLDVTKQRIAEDLFKVLTAAGVDFGVLGADETCCGDPARALGDEMTYQMIAKAQAEAIKSRKYKVLLVSCPHCLHNLANEYKTLGVDLAVMHHSQYLQQLLAQGKLKLDGRLGKKVTFHDPCYLGRYQRIFAPARQLLGAIPGAEVTEMAEHHEDALCCGAGGGHFWMDFEAPKRINNLRMEQAMAAGAEVVATGCPFCMQMLVDSVSILDLGEKVKVQDIATLVAERLPTVESAPTEA